MIKIDAAKIASHKTDKSPQFLAKVAISARGWRQLLWRTAGVAGGVRRRFAHSASVAANETLKA